MKWRFGVQNITDICPHSLELYANVTVVRSLDLQRSYAIKLSAQNERLHSSCRPLCYQSHRCTTVVEWTMTNGREPRQHPRSLVVAVPETRVNHNLVTITTTPWFTSHNVIYRSIPEISVYIDRMLTKLRCWKLAAPVIMNHGVYDNNTRMTFQDGCSNRHLIVNT